MFLLLLRKLVTTPTRYLGNLIKILATVPNEWYSDCGELHSSIWWHLYIHIRHYTGTPGADTTCHIVTLSRLRGYLVSTLCCKLWCGSELGWRMIINCWRGGLIFIKSQTAAQRLVRQNQSLLRDCRHGTGNFVWIQNIAPAKSSIWTLYKTQFL